MGMMAKITGIIGTSFRIGLANAATLSASALTAARTFALPDRDGSVALTLDAYHPITIVVDGQGSVPAAGTKARIVVPVSGTILGLYCFCADGTTGTFVFDVWKTAFSTSAWPTIANTIVASDKPTLSAAMASSNNTLTGWTVSVAQGDMLVVNLDSCSGTTKPGLILFVKP